MPRGKKRGFPCFTMCVSWLPSSSRKPKKKRTIQRSHVTRYSQLSSPSVDKSSDVTVKPQKCALRWRPGSARFGVLRFRRLVTYPQPLTCQTGMESPVNFIEDLNYCFQKWMPVNAAKMATLFSFLKTAIDSWQDWQLTENTYLNRWSA